MALILTSYHLMHWYSCILKCGLSAQIIFVTIVYCASIHGDYEASSDIKNKLNICLLFLMMIVSCPMTRVSEGLNSHCKQKRIKSKRKRKRFDISLNPSARKSRLKRHCSWIRITHNAHQGHNLEQEDGPHANMPIYTDLTSAVPR